MPTVARYIYFCLLFNIVFFLQFWSVRGCVKAGGLRFARVEARVVVVQSGSMVTFTSHPSRSPYDDFVSSLITLWSALWSFSSSLSRYSFLLWTSVSRYGVKGKLQFWHLCFFCVFFNCAGYNYLLWWNILNTGLIRIFLPSVYYFWGGK